jgi:hypothetical protein
MINGFHDNYIQAAIDGEIARLACSQEGERNNRLLRQRHRWLASGCVKARSSRT